MPNRGDFRGVPCALIRERARPICSHTTSTLSRIGIGLLFKTRPPRPGPGSEPSGIHDAPATLLPRRPRAAPFGPLPWDPTASPVALRCAQGTRQGNGGQPVSSRTLAERTRNSTRAADRSVWQVRPGCPAVLPLPESEGVMVSPGSAPSSQKSTFEALRTS